jgi:Holliday junction DNA helicase RuvB
MFPSASLGSKPQLACNVMITAVNSFDEYIGQKRAKAILTPALEATKFGKTLDHILFYGPAGVGKSTIASLIANFMGTRCTIVDSRNLEKVSDFIKIVSNLSNGDVLFLDEIHGLSKDLEETLYSAIDNYKMNAIGKNGESMIINTPHFVLVGATTKLGEMSRPLKTRFGLVVELEPYSVEDLAEIVINKGIQNDIFLTRAAAIEVARRSRQTARVAEKLLSRVQDHALITGYDFVDADLVNNVMRNLDIDRDGLTKKDKQFMSIIKNNFGNNPTSLSSLAAVMNDSVDNLYETIEPFLIQKGFINRTPRGRILTPLGLAEVRQ